MRLAKVTRGICKNARAKQQGQRAAMVPWDEELPLADMHLKLGSLYGAGTIPRSVNPAPLQAPQQNSISPWIRIYLES